jgi:hypothetical protein
MDAKVLKRDDLPWSEIAHELIGADEEGEGQLRQIDIHVNPTFSAEWL